MDTPEGMTPSAQELEQKNTPSFLDKLKLDYPEEEERIAALLPAWQQAVDDYVGVSGFSNDVLSAVEYISREEMGSFVDGVASEVQQLTEGGQNPVYFVHYGAGSRSGEFFYSNVANRLSPVSRSAFQLVETGDMYQIIESDKTKNPEVVICDDSINSGEQIDMILTPLSGMGREYGKQIRVHVRVMRIADDGARVVANLKKQLPYLDLDIKSRGRMPNMLDVTSKYPNLSKDLPLLESSNATTQGAATLGVFYHKIQDNLPGIFMGGWDEAERQLKQRKTVPLFKDSVIKSYPKNI